MNSFRAAAVAASVAVYAPAAVAAQSGGPYAPLVLMLPAGARPLALGNAGVGSRDDDVLFYNPAQLAVARGTSGSVERFSPTSGGGTLSSVTRLTGSAVAIGVRVVDYEPGGFFLNNGTAVTTFPATRRTTLQTGMGAGTSIEASLGYASTIKGIRIGAAAKYVEDEVPNLRVGRAAFDVGLAKDLFRFYTVALAVQNMGASMSVPCATVSASTPGDCVIPPPVPVSGAPLTLTDVKLPLRTTLGGTFSHQLGELDLVATAAVSMLRKSYLTPAGGAELTYSWIDGYNIQLRAGARRPLPGEGTLTGGLGLTGDRLSLDYAIESLAASRVGHRFGFRIR